ncbi:hypothetical protein NOF55_16120 [Rhizobiaceae bacterium BDR2-2]|uniref:Transglutaminase-like superfamily protein n=1 Tax=Ectorhizobium quercum TaxID=2965071 RepID=A0AAE3N3I9_9HYPH|nr:hypothetical protein [Ectorhizobium quercum]MCX8996321.1 hypothetical protein [Ectorhizobium quercum]MCX8998640.1 hypothetical protein [Ectorhizobium quercum]
MRDEKALYDLAAALRRFMPDLWREWHMRAGSPLPSPLSTDTCGRTSLVLQGVLADAGFQAVWRSGAADAGCGFFDGARWRSHSWIECGPFVVDITADQFGAAPVVVALVTDGRYRPGGGDRASGAARLNRRRCADTALLRWRQAVAPGRESG